jgi:caa(3)-type oxidase subunit IV
MSEIATSTHEDAPESTGSAMRTGAAVFLALAVFTIVEYFVAQEVASPLVPLFLIAAVKAGLILWYFMHVARSWRGGHH